MNRHLTDEEILDLLAPGVEPVSGARDHLATCPACRARIESERPLSERVARLPDATDPPRDLWPALREGLATSEIPAVRRMRPRRVPLQAAAAVAFFLLGVLAGRAWQPDPGAPPPISAGEPMAAAAEVQRTGTAYVEAVARLRAVAAGSEAGPVEQAREVALAAVHGAAWELARLRPDDATAREIMALAGERRRAEMAR